MKKLSALVLALLLTLLLALPAFADEIWYPDNDFLSTHYGECEIYPRQRSYYANSRRGYLNLRSSPGGQVLQQVKNGERLTGTARYQDWICVVCDDQAEAALWAPAKELSLIYDYIAFAEDYSGQLSPGTGEAVETFLASREGDNLVVWPYPNAERADWAWDNGGWVYETVSLQGFTYTYTDPEGYLWGACCLPEFGNVWLCLNAPDAGDGYTEIAQLEGGQVTFIPNPKPRIVSVREIPADERYPAREPVPPYVLPGALVGLVTLLSAAALRIFYGRKRKKGGSR